MALRPSPPLWIGFVLSLTLSMLWETLLITSCVPPLAGQKSILSNLHLLELAVNNQSVRFGYLAFCSSTSGTQICSTIANAMNPSPQQVADKLPNLNAGLFNMAFFLNRKVFPILPALTLTFLILGAICIVLHWVFRKKGSGKKTQLMLLGTFAFLGLALAFAMVSAVAITLITTALVNLSNMTNLGFTITRGENAFRFHWLSFGFILLSIAFAGIILPNVSGGDSGGGGDDDEYYDDKDY